MKKKEQINNSYLRYANCWEDAEVLLQGLNVQSGDSVLSIGSGGDNSFSLLANAPKIVVAVDINKNQLQVIELKKAAFKALNHNQFLEFLGFRESANRKELLELVFPFLKPEGREYWQEKWEEIEAGIIHQGKFEKYFEKFRTKVLPKIHKKEKVDLLLESKTPKEQEIFFYAKWNTWRWKLLFKVFFSKYVMGKLGRDPRFLKQVAIPVSSYVLDKAASQLSSTYAQSNYFLEYILKGEFTIGLPHYARKENYESIRKNIDKLVVYEGFAQDVFKHYGGFNKFNLSNIFEYMSQSEFESISKIMAGNSIENSTFCYWNLMVERKMSEVEKEFNYDKSNSNKWTVKDKGFFYKNFIIETK